MEFGTKIVGDLQYIPREMLTDSVIGSIYEVGVNTSGVSDPTETAALLAIELPKQFPGIKINWIDISDSQIRIQLTGSPFMWASFLLFIPTLLAMIGVAVVMIGVFLLLSHVPGYVIGLILVGVSLVILGPKFGDWALAGIPTIQ